MDLQRYSNFVFTGIYIVEMLLKLFALGGYYFYFYWNVFDFTLVATSIVDIAIEEGLDVSELPINPATLRCLKIVRIGRLLRLIRHMHRLRINRRLPLRTPAFGNIVLLLFLLLFMFAVLGVSLFSDAPIDGEFINKHANFQTLQVGWLTLFSSVTGENWNGLMHEVAELPGMNTMATGFFSVFYVTASFILLNLVIAVILENYGNSVDDSLREVPQEALANYREEWERLDPEATGNISSDQLMLLLRRVREPLGFKKADGGGRIWPKDQQMHFVTELNVHDHGGKLSFQVLLQALTQHAHSHGKFKETAAADGSDLPEDEGIQAKITKQLRSAFRAAHAYDLAPPEHTQAELHAALTLQAAWRGKLGRVSPWAEKKARAGEPAATMLTGAASLAASGERPSTSSVVRRFRNTTRVPLAATLITAGSPRRSTISTMRMRARRAHPLGLSTMSGAPRIPTLRASWRASRRIRLPARRAARRVRGRSRRSSRKRRTRS